MDTNKISVSLFVHDFQKEIGHSRALIEKVRTFPANEIETINIYAYKCSDIRDLFPVELSQKVKWVRIPFPNIKPAFLKVLFYQVWCLIHTLLFEKTGTVRIGVGTAFFPIHIVDVQFYQRIWAQMYFDVVNSSLIKKLYRKFYFLYQLWAEDEIFKNPTTQVASLSGFIQYNLNEDLPSCEGRNHLIYSGINLNEFKIPDELDSNLIQDLVKTYPSLGKIDFSRHVFLFVGAFERKGLPKILEDLSNTEGSQLIVVGTGESDSKLDLSRYPFVAHIPFTKRISDIYSIADSFIFHSYYEPFGLVLIEAFAMGCQVISSYKNVGSMEIIKDLPGVFDYKLENLQNQQNKVSIENRSELIKQRVEHLKKFSWENSAAKFHQLIRNAHS